ncbi:MarR family winged helix-turn-helix transcriptional regulator [Streptomyces melanosporofaciens]|uniref:DNA-binding transcriptional regulator, MarR family n=1 Tax=Streptomyces melanosporofaciens TaxID=67327 RepID=A0A1H5C6J6_STRMJ|nr:MarR family transcriptional regulator [Streptomyces melanosporofaciens]SED62236.1 DNA-binding transcriptional regulator, MarR family [Streptomyces melanosporofaciens]
MEDDTLAEDLRQAIGELVRAVRAADTMPSGEAAILGHLDRGGPQTTADLAHRRGVTHQSAAKSVKELLGAGLVRAEPHPSDGRKLLLDITDTGRARLRQERAQRATSLGAAIGDALSTDEQRRLRDCVPLLSRLTTHITGK